MSMATEGMDATLFVLWGTSWLNLAAAVEGAGAGRPQSA